MTITAVTRRLVGTLLYICCNSVGSQRGGITKVAVATVSLDAKGAERYDMDTVSYCDTM
jgi:hypothetical protein